MGQSSERAYWMAVAKRWDDRAAMYERQAAISRATGREGYAAEDDLVAADARKAAAQCRELAQGAVVTA